MWRWETGRLRGWDVRIRLVEIRSTDIEPMDMDDDENQKCLQLTVRRHTLRGEKEVLTCESRFLEKKQEEKSI